MSELGKTLKAQRERLSLSLSEASLSTKIGARMIAAIEEGDFDALPALPFAKGFVRSYASYLKLDADQMVALYLDEIGELQKTEPPVDETEKSEPAPPVDINDDSGGLTRFFIIGGVIVLIAAIVGVKSLVEKYKKEADVSHQTEVSVSPIEKEPEEPKEATVPTGSETQGEASEASVEPEKVPEVQPSEEPVKEESAVAAPTPTPEQPTEAAPAPTTPEPTSTPESTAEESTEVAEKKQVEILLEALDRVQVNLSIGGESKRVSLNAGEVHILRTDEKVQLDISDAGAVNLVVNGQSRGVPGSLGQRKKVQLP